MKHTPARQLLIAISLAAVPLVATANQAPAPDQPRNEIVPPEPNESRPEAKPALPAAGPRGQMLYENHCRECHTSVVHVREMRRVHSMDDLEHWVKRWAGTLKLRWSAEDINDVINYLNQRYYKFK